MIIRNQHLNISDSRRYDGFIVDLMDKVSKTLGFRYQLTPVADGRYGYRQTDGSWDGMVGELTGKVGTYLFMCWYNIPPGKS